MNLCGLHDGAYTAKGAQAKENGDFDPLLQAQLEVPDDEDWGGGEEEIFKCEVG